MNWIASESERVGAATDVLVAVVAIVCAWRAHLMGRRQRFKARVWMSVFGLLAISAFLGSVSHALVLPDAIQDALWRPIYFALGITVALFVVGVIHDAWDETIARRWLGIMIGLGIAFYLVRTIISGSFLVFILYESAAMLFALGMYAMLALRRRAPGALQCSIGILFSLIAAALQATARARIECVWTFDHNALFHVIQLPGLAFLSAGIGMSFDAHGT